MEWRRKWYIQTPGAQTHLGHFFVAKNTEGSPFRFFILSLCVVPSKPLQDDDAETCDLPKIVQPYHNSSSDHCVSMSRVVVWVDF